MIKKRSGAEYDLLCERSAVPTAQGNSENSQNNFLSGELGNFVKHRENTIFSPEMGLPSQFCIKIRHRSLKFPQGKFAVGQGKSF